MKKLILLLVVLLFSCDMILLYQSPDPRFTGEWEYYYQGAGEYFTKESYEFDNTNKTLYYYYHNDYQYIYAPEGYIDYYFWKVSGDTIYMTNEYSGNKIDYQFYFSGNSLFLRNITYGSDFFVEYIKK